MMLFICKFEFGLTTVEYCVFGILTPGHLHSIYFEITLSPSQNSIFGSLTPLGNAIRSP